MAHSYDASSPALIAPSGGCAALPMKRIMSHRIKSLGLALLALITLVPGCFHSSPEKRAEFQAGESLVLAGEEPGKLAFTPLTDRPFTLRSTYLPGLTNTFHYEAGRDFLVDANGAVRRTRASRIPDFTANMLHGKKDFQHGDFPGFGNSAFFVYADYYHPEKWQPPAVPPDLGAKRLPVARQKLRSGQTLKIVAFGDSITAGGDASAPELIFWMRYAESLRRKYPKASVEAINGATGGDRTVEGLKRLEEKVLRQKPDLVLVGFGMNDHNREGFGVPVPEFAANLGLIVDQIKASGAEVILFSAFPPNPLWHYGSHNMEAYAAATESVAQAKGCAFADVYHTWQSVAERKQPEDLLANNINHPNDFGHYLYFRALQAIGL